MSRSNNSSITSNNSLALLPTAVAVTQALPTSEDRPLAKALRFCGFKDSFTGHWVAAETRDPSRNVIQRLEHRVGWAIRNWAAYHCPKARSIQPYSPVGVTLELLVVLVVGYVAYLIEGNATACASVTVIVALAVLLLSLPNVGVLRDDEGLANYLLKQQERASGLCRRSVKSVALQDYECALPSDISSLIDSLWEQVSEMRVMIHVPYREAYSLRKFVEVKFSAFCSHISWLNPSDVLAALPYDTELHIPIVDTSRSVFLEFILGSEHYVVACWPANTLETSPIRFSDRPGYERDNDLDLDLSRLA